jgi:Cytochrome c7 and related cytochrome c/Class III cytochrome C family
MAKLFPRSVNKLPVQITLYLCVVAGIATAGATYYMTPKYTRVGYAPIQPVPFSHAKHAGELGIDCRYCHSKIETAAASVPTAQTCMNCHNQIKATSPALEAVRTSYQTGQAIPWVHVHVLPSFVYFDHSIHVNRGISCVECHGKVNEMDVVTQVKPMSMGFCLDCHRAPEGHVREKADIYNLDSPTLAAAQGIEAGRAFVHDWNIKPPQSCSGCHR